MKSFKMIIATVVALFAFNAIEAQTLQEVQTTYNEAVTLMQAKNYVDAIGSLEKTVEMGLNVEEATDIVMKAQSYIPTCNQRAGLAAAQGGKFDEAIKYLTTAIAAGEAYGDTKTSTNSKSALSKVYTAMGGEAFNSKDYATAVDIFSKGYEVNPQDTNLAMNLAMSYCELGKLDEGMAVYQQVIALGDRHSRFHAAAADAKEKVAYYLLLKASDEIAKEDNDAAYATLQQCLTIDPVSIEANILRIQTATNAKQWDKVIEWGNAATDAWAAAQAAAEEGVTVVDPAKVADVNYFVAAAYDSKDNNAKAIEYYSKVTGDKQAAAKSRIEELKALNK